MLRRPRSNFIAVAIKVLRLLVTQIVTVVAPQRILIRHLHPTFLVPTIPDGPTLF